MSILASTTIAMLLADSRLPAGAHVSSGALEAALRAYQGRALYSGPLSDEVLLPLAEKYGLIL